MAANLGKALTVVRSAAELILDIEQRPNAAIEMRRDQFSGEWMTVWDEKGREAYEVFCPSPLGYDLVEKALRGWRKSLGEKAAPYTLHGLRKLSIVRLAEAGCSDAQIQAITNQSPEMVAYYRRRASRKAQSKAAHALSEQYMKVEPPSGTETLTDLYEAQSLTVNIV